MEQEEKALEKVSQKTEKKESYMSVWFLSLLVIVIVFVFLVVAVSYEKNTYNNSNESIANSQEQENQSEQTDLIFNLKNKERVDNAKNFNIKEGEKWLRNYYGSYDDLQIYTFPTEGAIQEVDVDIQRILVRTEEKMLGHSENLYKKDCYVYAIIGIVGNNIFKRGVILRKLNNKYAIEIEYVY